MLDLSRILAGPWCTQILADLGADVIKVERPGRRRRHARLGPALPEGRRRATTPSEAAYYLAANRGKRSITLDIASDEGAALAREIAAKADILVENYKVGGLAKYGLDYASLKHGQSRPDLLLDHRLRPGRALCAARRLRLRHPGHVRLHVDHRRARRPAGRRPAEGGVAITDLTTGLYATISILAALHHRNNTGQGQYIDMALLDSAVALMANMNMNYLTSGEPPTRYGNAHPTCCPTRCSTPPTIRSSSPSATTASSAASASSPARRSWPTTRALPPTRRASATATR